MNLGHWLTRRLTRGSASGGNTPTPSPPAPETRPAHGSHRATSIGGRTYVLESGDDYLDNMNGVFEPETVRLLQAVADRSGTVLDVGANVGCTALLLAQNATAVHAFEPSPTSYAHLVKNLERAEVTTVYPYDIALGAESRDTTLTFAPNNRSGAFISDQMQPGGGHATERVHVQTMDDVLGSLGVTDVEFIKIDAEGYEPYILTGAQRTLSTWEPAVVLELNHWCLNVFHRISVPDFFDQLRETFPIVLAVHGQTYLDLRDETEAYYVSYHHILNREYASIVTAFRPEQLTTFYAQYTHGPYDG